MGGTSVVLPPPLRKAGTDSILLDLASARSVSNVAVTSCPNRGVVHNFGGWSCLPLFRRVRRYQMEGLANLSTDRDYNQLVKHVNVNRPRSPDVSCYRQRIFSI